ncbi:Ig-like domain-containing protein, partial [Altererythrobacter sp. C41]|uniref:Ig-like domain-containing protein n=1 Tax=Altererythrobacter sp. C41 TaxID=2806021 RepID=UPI001934216E
MDKLDAVRGHGALEEFAVEAGDTGQYPANDPLLMDQGEQNLAVGNAQAPVGQSGDNPSFAMAKKRDADDEEEEGQENDASETREGGEQASQDGQSQSSDQPVDPQAENAESGDSQVESGSTGGASGGLGGPALIGGGIAGLGLLSIVLSNGGDEDSVAPPPPPPNRAPTATADTVAATEDAGVVAGTVAANDSDPDGDTLSYTLDAAVAGLTLNADGSYSFDPSDAAYQDLGAGETRDVVASYTVSDGNGGTASSTLT